LPTGGRCGGAPGDVKRRRGTLKAFEKHLRGINWVTEPKKEGGKRKLLQSGNEMVPLKKIGVGGGRRVGPTEKKKVMVKTEAASIGKM